MAAEIVTLDPSGTAVLLDDAANGIRLIAHDYPDPAPAYMGASSADTEGTIPVQNQLQDREITAVVRCFDVAAADGKMRARVNSLQQKVARFNRELNGVYKRTLSDATVINFTVKSASIDVPANWQFLQKKSVEVTLKLTCDPLGYGTEINLADHAEVTLPCVVGVDTGVTGDAPALGRLVIDNDATSDQWHVIWGCESLHYSAANTAALFYEAESLVRQNSAACTLTAVGSASGGTVIRHTSLSTSYQAVVQGQMGAGGTAGTAYLTHVGDYEVWARFMPGSGNSGTVSVALEWGLGDFRRFTQNDPVTPATTLNGQWVRRSLGLVHLPEPVTGAQRFEPRILAKSTTAGDDIDVDYLYLVPVTECSGVARAVAQVASPTVFTARDEFDQAAGALDGKTLPVGGTWSNAGDADDFSVNGSGAMSRAATSDSANTGRWARAGTSTPGDITVQVDVSESVVVASSVQSVLARYTDASNYLRAGLTGDGIARVTKRVAGTVTHLASVSIDRTVSDTHTIRLTVDVRGQYRLWAFKVGAAAGDPLVIGYDADLATGGTLATGKVGLYDESTSASPSGRTYDNFIAYVPALDAAIFAGQSLEVRHSSAVREDGGGSVWPKPSRYDGDYARPWPAGAEARSLRTIVAVHRADPETTADAGIDDVSFRWSITPRYLSVPAP